MKALQEIQGELQDAVVVRERIRRRLPNVECSAGAFAVGRMVELQAARKRKARAGFPAAWTAVQRSGKKAWR